MTLTTRTKFNEAVGPHVSFSFGRMNPPHYGHEGLIKTLQSVAKNGAWALFLSKSQDAKKNPLTYAEKLAWVKTLYPQTQGHLVEDSSIKTFLEAASHLYDKGFRSATFVAGEDDMASMRPVLEKYNGKEMGHGYYQFEPLTFMESPRLTSATNAREAAKEGNPEKFELATRVPQNIIVDGKTLFQAVRRGMGLGEAVEESIIAESLSVEQLAHISDKALDDAYHYGLSTPGANFGWLANIESAAAAKRMIDSGITDVDAIASAIHDGWNKTAVADYMGKLQLDTPTIPDKKKKRYALAQQTYAQLPEVEKEKDRVVARAMLKALGIVNEFAPSDSSRDGGNDGFSEEQLKKLAARWWNNDEDPQVERMLELSGWSIGQDENYDNGGAFVVMIGDDEGHSFISWPAEDLENIASESINEDLTPDQWNELRIADPKAYMGNKDYNNRRWWTLQFKKARAAARERGAQRFEFPPGSKNSYMVAPDLANEGKVTLYTDPDYFGAEVDDSGFGALPIINIPTNKLVGFEPDEKMELPKAKANVAKIIDGLEKNENIPPILVRKYKSGYQVLDGHHRFWAYKTLKKDSIPARLVSDSDIEEISKNKVNEAAEKSTKATAKYQAMPRNGQRCDHCTMWRPPHGCSAVSGKIAPNGWCSYYKRSHRSDVDESENLDEAASSVLFHYTGSLGAALNILKNNEFALSISTGTVEAQYAPKGYNYFLSATRSKVGGYHEIVGDTGVMFNLDGNWFNSRYPVKAIDYWAGMHRGDRHNESEDRIFAREPSIPADAITAIHILLKEKGEYGSPTTRQLMITSKKRGLPTYLYSDESAWRLQDIRRALPVSAARDILSGIKKTGYISSSNFGKRMLGPWLELIFKKSRSELSKKANDLRYSLTYWNGGQFSDDLGLRNEISNARKPGNSGYAEANKIIAAMRKIGANDVRDLLMFLHKKWDAEAMQPAKSDNAAQSAIAKIRASAAKKESVEEALDPNETHGWILPNRKVEYVGTEEHEAWLDRNGIGGYEEAYELGYVRFVNLSNTFFLEGTLSGLKKLYRVYAASALSRPNIAVDVYNSNSNRGNANSSHDFRIPQEKAKFIQLFGPSSVGEHAGSILGTVGGGAVLNDRKTGVFPWDRWIQPDTGNSKLDYVDDLDEVNMSPSALSKFATTPQAQAMTIGFEAEMLVPGLKYDDDDDEDYGGVSQAQYVYRRDSGNWDLSKDAPFPTDKEWVKKVLAWASESSMLDAEDIGNIRVELLDMKKDFVRSVGKKSVVSAEIVKPENLKWIAKQIYDNNDGGYRAGGFSQKDLRNTIMREPTYEYGVPKLAREIYRKKMIADLTPEEYEKLFKKFLKDAGQIDTISDWFLEWAQPNSSWAFYPFLTGTLPQDSKELTVKELANSWKAVIGAKVKYGGGYHGLQRDATSWILEPDGSISGKDNGIELISPPMPLQQGLTALDTFFGWASEHGYYGNDSTGFHVGVSLPSELQANIDPLKVVMLLGDKYVLDLFDRSSNAYTQSSLGQVKELLTSRRTNVKAEDYAKVLRNNLAKTAQAIVNRMGDNKYVSVHLKSNYIEFRSAGGNFLEHIDDIKNTVLRYVQVMAIAADPQAYREEYAKKLYKLISKNIPQGDDQLANFAMYASGLIDQNVLKMRLQKRQVDKAQAAADAKTKVYRIWIGTPPHGSNLSDPKRFATPGEAYAWAKSYAKRVNNFYNTKDLYLEPDDHSLPPLVLNKPLSGAWLQ